MKWLVVIALAAASGSSLTFLVWRPILNSPVQVPLNTRFEAAQSRIIEGTGYVEPMSGTRQLSPKSGGVIKAYYVKVGDKVCKGEKILTLHDEKEAAAVSYARKQLEVALAEEAQVKSGINLYRVQAAEKAVTRFQAEYKYAMQEADRTRRLYVSRSVSQSDMESADARRLQMEASLHEAEAGLLHLRNYVRVVDEVLMKAKVSQAQANLELVEQQQRDLFVLAPFDGTILKLLKRPGEGVRMIELEPVVIFGDLSRLRLRAEIDERYVMDLRIDQPAEAYGPNLFGRTYSGRVVEVEKLMGDKTVFARASSERKDLNVLQVVIEMDSEFSAPVGLRVDIRIRQDKLK